MNIYIVDDRPQTMLLAIKEIQDLGGCVHTVFSFSDNEDENDTKKNRIIESKFHEIGVSLEPINSKNFAFALDQVYKEPDTIFLFDFDLTPEESIHPDERINVEYALSKYQQDPANFKIWFYTTGTATFISSISKMFGNRLIPIKKFDIHSHQLSLDLTVLKQTLRLC